MTSSANQAARNPRGSTWPHKRHRGERGGGGEKDTKAADSNRRAATTGHGAPGETQPHPPTQRPGGTTGGRIRTALPAGRLSLVSSCGRGGSYSVCFVAARKGR